VARRRDVREAVLGRPADAGRRGPARRRRRDRRRGRRPGRGHRPGTERVPGVLASPRGVVAGPRRWLASNRGRGVPRRRRLPVPRRPHEGPRDRLRLQRVPEGGRGRAARAPGDRGGGGGGSSRPADRRGGEGVRRDDAGLLAHRGGHHRRRRTLPRALQDPAGDRARGGAAAPSHRQGAATGAPRGRRARNPARRGTNAGLIMWIFPLLAALVSLAFAAVLARQAIRPVRPAQAMWAIALLMYAAASFAMFLGALTNWTPV